MRRKADGTITSIDSAPLNVSETQDLKGFYKRAWAELVARFAGIDEPYEPSLSSDIEFPTVYKDVRERTREQCLICAARFVPLAKKQADCYVAIDPL